MPNLVKGTLLLAGATMLCRVLGLIYYFPFLWLVGLQGAALYAYGYNPYMIMLSISTMGLPLAVSKFVAKYHALGDYQTTYRLFKSGLVVLSITGFFSCALLMAFAPTIAQSFIGEDAHPTGNSLGDTILVIRVVSLALLIVPIMSLIRGYFQGLQQMLPTAISQVVEQLVRIGFILISGLLIIKVWHGSMATAVAFAVLAAFMGAMGGLLVLLWFWHQHQPTLKQQLLSSTSTKPPALLQIYQELIGYAMPFVFVSLAIPMFLMIDSLTINTTLMSMGYTLQAAENIFSVINQTTHKIIMIPVALATALGLTLIPAMTQLFTENDQQQLQQTINHTMQLLLFLTLPAVVGLTLLAHPIYGVLYIMQDIQLGGDYLAYYAPTALLFAFFTATAAILQGINQQKIAVFALLIGAIIKYVINAKFILWLGGLGAIAATNIGYFATVLINLIMISYFTQFSLLKMFAGTMNIILIALLMAVVILFCKQYILPYDISNITYWQLTAVLFLNITIGGLVYLGIGFKSGIAAKIINRKT